MRESTSTYPLQNRACVSITPHMYDRRALDVKSALPLLNNLTGLTFLTSTSPRIRDILTQDGGLERLLDIMRESCKERTTPVLADIWGLNGPTTSKVLGIDRQNGLKHSLAFQCVVNIGVRGSEQVRTRVVQSGALDLVAHILEQWMEKRSIYVHPHSLGSIQAVKLFHQGGPLPTRSSVARIIQPTPVRRPVGASDAASTFTALDSEPPATTPPPPVPVEMMQVEPASPVPEPAPPVEAPLPEPPMPEAVAADVDMDDSEVEDPAIQSAGEDAAPMEVDPPVITATPDAAMVDATPRATGSRLPNPPPGALDIPIRPTEREDQGQLSSGANSLTGSEDDRGVSDNELPEAGRARQRPSALNLRVPGLAAGGASNQSSPMGTPTRMEPGELMRNIVRRDTITARTVQLEQLTQGVAQDTAGTEGVNTENPQLGRDALTAGMAAAIRTDDMEFEDQVEPPEVEIVEIEQGADPEGLDPDFLAAEQARLDLAAGAPPGQPGAAVITPPAAADGPIEGVIAPDTVRPTVFHADPVNFPGLRPGPGPPPTAVGNPGAQVIIANGAPRGFHELAAYVGISSVIHPKGDRFSDDSVLLCLQLLAYLSKYPHVRTAFHHPHLPMHRTFEYGQDDELPERPHISATRNMFSLVERFCFRASAQDPTMFRVPNEIQYWAGVIMRNACRKDDLQNGIRQCAHMNCGKWETFAREFAKCRRCRKAKYCSKTCQSAAWAEGHRFWCSPRPDADAPPDPNAPVTQLPPVVRRPELHTAEGRLGMNFWELAITLGLEGPSHVTLLRLLADSPVPEGHDIEAIVRWILQDLVPYLLSRPDEQVQFLGEINRDPQVAQSLFGLFAGDRRLLPGAIHLLFMQARREARDLREAIEAAADPTDEGRPQAPREVRPRPVVETVFDPNQTPERREARLAARFAAQVDQRVRRAARGTQPGQLREAGPLADAAPLRRATQTTQPLARPPLALGNWLPDLAALRPAMHAAVNPPAPTLDPAADVAFLQGQPRLPLFGRTEGAAPSPPRADRQPANTRGFSLTEVWRNMAGGRRDNNNNNGNTQAGPNPEDNQAGNAQD